MSINYTKSRGDLKHYLNHFTHCEEHFLMALSERVNIEEYALKLIEKAVNFEAWQEPQLVGLVNAYFNIETKTAYISNVSVTIEQQGKGIASILLDNCIKLASEKELKIVSLEVAISNSKAQALYKKYGFVISESNENNFIMTKQI